jgi:hypothetical protein
MHYGCTRACCEAVDGEGKEILLTTDAKVHAEKFEAQLGQPGSFLRDDFGDLTVLKNVAAEVGNHW